MGERKGREIAEWAAVLGGLVFSRKHNVRLPVTSERESTLVASATETPRRRISLESRTAVQKSGLK